MNPDEPENKDKASDGWASRKLWVSVGVFTVLEAIATVGLVVGKLSAAEWVEFSRWNGTATVGFFSIANVAEKSRLVS
jgi:hypothetical protein